jgi:hypothetical protein
MIMKVKIQFSEETCFVVPNRKALPTRRLKLFGNGFSFRALALLTERPKPWKRYVN